MGAARRTAAGLAGIVALVASVEAGAGILPTRPIPEEPTADAPRFIGAPAQARPIKHGTNPPRHPFMAPDGRSNIHVDPYMTDTNSVAGPLGRNMQRVSTFKSAECASVTFDSVGRIVSICVGLQGPRLVMLHPRTLDELATFSLPPRQAGGGGTGGDPFTDFSGGGYFYLDHRDRAVIPTTDRRILVVRETAGPDFEQVAQYDLRDRLERDDAIVSALPDYSGRIWFVTTNGVVGNVKPRSGRIRARTLRGEGITNSFAVDETGGVYVVTDRALYRFDTRRRGRIGITWRQKYPNTGEQKPGQVDDGSGTTPTVMGRQARRDHGQLGPDARDGLPARRATPGRREAQGLQRAGVRARRERHGQLADRHEPLDRRREQLRLRGPALDDPGRRDLARHHARERPAAERALPDGVGERRDQPHGRAQALAGERPRLRVHEDGRLRRPLVPDRDQLPHRADRRSSSSPASGWGSTTTTPRSRSARTEPRTSGCWADWLRCGTPRGSRRATAVSRRRRSGNHSAEDPTEGRWRGTARQDLGPSRRRPPAS